VNILSVHLEYLWTSAIVSDCKLEFTWCAINEKVVDHVFLEDYSKCLAVDLFEMELRNFNCTEKKFFACEVFAKFIYSIDKINF